jgi:SAM-dependent methyltransferase
MMHQGFYRGQYLFNPVSRRNKARKVTAVLSDHLSTPLASLSCLEVGCSFGIMTKYFAQAFKWVVGSDINQDAISSAARESTTQAKFIVADGAYLPFRDESFDVVICTQVYEHARNPTKLSEEIWRVLRQGGVCFFSGPNKLSLIEGHTGLPLIQWLPRRFADWLVRLLKRGDNFEVNLMTYWELRQLWRNFVIIDYGPTLITNPTRFSLSEEVPRIFALMPSTIYQLLAFAIPNLNWVLIKPVKGGQCAAGPSGCFRNTSGGGSQDVYPEHY